MRPKPLSLGASLVCVVSGFATLAIPPFLPYDPLPDTVLPRVRGADPDIKYISEYYCSDANAPSEYIGLGNCNSSSEGLPCISCSPDPHGQLASIVSTGPRMRNVMNLNCNGLKDTGYCVHGYLSDENGIYQIYYYCTKGDSPIGTCSGTVGQLTAQ